MKPESKEVLNWLIANPLEGDLFEGDFLYHWWIFLPNKERLDFLFDKEKSKMEKVWIGKGKDIEDVEVPQKLIKKLLRTLRKEKVFSRYLYRTVYAGTEFYYVYHW